MGVHKILSTCDRALVAYLISLDVGDESTIYPAKRALDKENPPYTVVMSTSGKPSHSYSGSWEVRVEIATHANAGPDVNEDEEQMQEDSDELASNVADSFLRIGEGEQSGGSLADEITAAARGAGLEFTAMDVQVVELEQGRTDKRGEWVDKLDLLVTCVAANI